MNGGMVVAVALVVILGGWIGIVSSYALSSISSDAYDKNDVVPLFLIGCAGVGLLVLFKFNKFVRESENEEE